MFLGTYSSMGSCFESKGTYRCCKSNNFRPKPWSYAVTFKETGEHSGGIQRNYSGYWRSCISASGYIHGSKILCLDERTVPVWSPETKAHAIRNASTAEMYICWNGQKGYCAVSCILIRAVLEAEGRGQIWAYYRRLRAVWECRNNQKTWSSSERRLFAYHHMPDSQLETRNGHGFRPHTWAYSRVKLLNVTIS